VLTISSLQENQRLATEGRLPGLPLGLPRIRTRFQMALPSQARID